MKVLILTETSAPSRYWEAALPMLKDKGIDVSFATTQAAGEIHSRLRSKNIDTIGFGVTSSRDYPLAAYRLANFLKEQKTDVVHASEPIQAAIAGFACIAARNVKSVFHYHHTHVSGKQRLFSRIGSRLSTRVMAVSRAAREAAVNLDGTPLERTTIAYNGIEPLRSVAPFEVSQLRERLEIPNRGKIVTIVSRLRPVKGHRTLFKACEIVDNAIPDPLHLIVVGDGEERDVLESESGEFGRFKIHFVGNQNDVALWFGAADAVAMPSYFEPFGLVAVEAMVCGRAVIASNVEGPAEIIEDGKSGILVPPKDPAALAQAIEKVLCSPEYARELGENAKQRVLENFTMEKMVDRWIECYEIVLKTAN